jgi:hypothetical protein
LRYWNVTSSKRISPRSGAAGRSASGGVDEVGLLVEQLEDLVQRGHARLVLRVELRELLDRVEEAGSARR